MTDTPEPSGTPASEPAPMPAAEGGAAGTAGPAADPWSALGETKLFAATVEESDVSIVYIDRRNQAFYGNTPPAPGRTGDRPATAPRSRADWAAGILRSAEVDMVRFTFIPPAGYADAQRRLRAGGLLILQGPAGSGKRSTAIHLLSSLRFAAEGETAIHELNADLQLRDLGVTELPANTALLLDIPGGAALEGLTGFRWRELPARLQELQSALVVTLEQAPAGFTRERRDDICAWSGAWEGERTAVQWDLLQRHLAWLIRQETVEPEHLTAQMAEWRRQPALASLLEQRLPPGDIVDLAHVLLAVLTGAHTLDQALQRHGQTVAAAVRTWFGDGSHPLERKALLVAAAVFNGALADEVDAAAAALTTALQPPAPPTPAQPPAPVDPFGGGNTRTARYQAIGATPVALSIQGLHYGDTTGLGLRLDNAVWQTAVLDYLWTELSALREPLLAWLERYALEGSQRQRVRAAAAIGGLARLNFPLIEARVLRPWAQSNNPDARRAAGLVLGITIWDEQQSAASAGLLRHWATTDNWRYRWTAAAACGGLAGRRFPQLTLELLAGIAAVCVEQPQLLTPLTEAIIRHYLALQEEPALRAELLHTLRLWSERTATERAERAHVFALRRTALLSFWALLWPDPRDPAWRRLVTDMAVAGAPMQEDGIALLRAAFNFRQPDGSVRDKGLHPRHLAHRGLRALVEALAREKESPLFAVGAAVLQALVNACRQADAANGDDTEWGRLRDSAVDWEPLPEDAEPLRSLLLYAE